MDENNENLVGNLAAVGGAAGAPAPQNSAVAPENVETRAAEYLAGWKRAQADYANLQREMAEERSQMGAFATARAVSEFLPVYDYYKRALAHAPSLNGVSPAVVQWATGISHIRDLFKNTLVQLGVSEMETIGKLFDPATMEAVKEEARDGAQPHTIIEELEGGYMMNDKVIKAAKVVVAGNSDASDGVPC